MQKNSIKEIIKSLNLPQNEILFLHVALKGLGELPYNELSKQIVGYLEEFYKPKTILIPTYTYSFTQTPVFNRNLSASQVGRFGEEIRLLYGSKHRTSNPVFSVIDKNKVFVDTLPEDIHSAFAFGSLFYTLALEGYIMINLNLDKLLPAHLHYIEWYKKVPYRYSKIFNGEVFNGETIKVNYNYFVRNLDQNSAWDRSRIQNYLESKAVVKNSSIKNCNLLWMHSKDMDRELNKVLDSNPLFLLKK